MDGARAGVVQIPDGLILRAVELSTELDTLETSDDIETSVTLARAVAAERAAEALGEIELLQRARMVQADMHSRNGEMEAAARIFAKVHRWAVKHDCRPVQAEAHRQLSGTYYCLGDRAAALEHAVRSVELSDEATPPVWRALRLRRLADALSDDGSFEEARERYRQAEQLFVAAGHAGKQLTVLNNLAYAEISAGDLPRAWAVVERMRVVVAAAKRPFDHVELDTIARVLLALGRYAEAEQTVQEGLRNPGPRPERDAEASLFLTLAEVQRQMGASDRAQASLDRARAACADRQLAGTLVSIEQEQAEIHAATGGVQRAFAAYKAFHEAAGALRSQQREAQARTRQAMLETAEARRDAELFREQARRDPLTGLRNRRYVDEQLAALIGNTDRAGPNTALTLALVDADHFKRINDTLSHEVGDQVLITISKLLTSSVATLVPNGFAARIGGEEFLLFLPDTGSDDAEEHLNAVRIAIATHDWRPITGDLAVTVSIGGITAQSDDLPTKALLLAEADRLLYVAKHAGRNRVAVESHPPRRRYRDVCTPDAHLVPDRVDHAHTA